MRVNKPTLIRRHWMSPPLMSLLFIVALSVTACGDHLIRGVSPVVRINELSHDGKNITLQLSLRNRNGVEMDVQHLDFVLNAEDEKLFSYTGPAETKVAANGTETWTVELPESESTQAKLNSLESGEIKSLPYSFSGKVTSVEDGDLKFENEGYLYPVPGRPGQFR